jgi:hypothetical protein
MHKKRAVMMAAAAAAALTVAASANAAVTFKYTTYTGTTPGSNPNFTDTAGTPLVVPIYLYEQITGGTPSVITGDGGLDAGSWSVTQTSGTSSGILTSIAGNTTLFTGPNNPSSKNSSTFKGFGVAVANNATSGIDPDGNGDISLGNVTITPTAVGTTTFVLDAFNYTGSGTKADGVTITFDNSYDLDGNSTSPAYTGAIANPETFTVTVAPVPEPTSAAVLGLGAMGLLARRRKLA